MKSRVSNDPIYEIRMAFDMIDTDNSGTISVKELRALMKRVNQHLDDEEISALMSECDLNNDRELDFEEFKNLMAS